MNSTKITASVVIGIPLGFFVLKDRPTLQEISQLFPIQVQVFGWLGVILAATVTLHFVVIRARLIKEEVKTKEESHSLDCPSDYQKPQVNEVK